MLRRLRGLVAVGVLLILDAGCRTGSDAGGVHSLPSVQPGATNFSEYQPDQPFVPTEKGFSERKMYTTVSPGGNIVEVRDYLVPPARSKVDLALKGAGILDVRLGKGEAQVGGKTIELQPDTVFTVNAGESLGITTGGEPLALRAWIVKEKR